MEYQKTEPKRWIKAVLLTGSIYFIIWGLLMMVYPSLLFHSNAIALPNYMFLWQTLGLVEALFGIGLFIASRAPYRQWSMILLVLLYKIFSAAIYFTGAFDNDKLWSISNYIFIDNIIWIVPLSVILYQAYLFHLSSDTYELEFFGSEKFTYDMFETSEGISLEEMNKKSPVMLVFLRHFGCTFCREAMHDIAQQRKQIESKGTRILIVHMLEDEDTAHEQLKKFGLADLPTLSDPEKLLYKKFQLKHGSLLQLFGLKVWFRGIAKGLFGGLGIGTAMGDPYQMPGVFLIYKNVVVKQFIHHSAADRPAYIQLAECENCL